MNFSQQMVALKTIVIKEYLRFIRIWIQTILPPAITIALYFIIFGEIIGSQIGDIDGYKYMDYIVPGLILMAVITNAYANVVSSFFSAKFHHSVEEIVYNSGPQDDELKLSMGKEIFSAMTLLRSVDWLSRDDFPSRKNTNAGPTLFTPGAQGIGRQNFHYAVMPCGPDIFAADVKAESEAYRVVPPVTQGVTDGQPIFVVNTFDSSAPEIPASTTGDPGSGIIVKPAPP